MKIRFYFLSIIFLLFLNQCSSLFLSNIDSIYFSSKKETIYLKQYSKISSISVIISLSKHFKKDDIVFNEDALFYKYNSDSLFIFSRSKPGIEKGHCGKIAIKYFKISNQTFYTLLDEYHEKGLFKFPK